MLQVTSYSCFDLFKLGLLGMWEPSREEVELFKLLDDDKLDEAVEKLREFSQQQLKHLLLEVRLLDIVLEAKISFLRQELGLPYNVRSPKE